MMKQRFIYGYPIGAFGIAILSYGNLTMFIMLMAFATILMIEFYELTGLRSDRRLFPMRRWGYCLGLIIMLLVFFNKVQYLDFAIIFFIIGAMIYRMANFHNRSGDFLRDLAVSILGGIYIGGFLSFFLRLRILGFALKDADIIPTGSGWLATIPFFGEMIDSAGWTSGLGRAMAEGPNWLVLLPILGSWGYDFSAIFTGLLLGKTPLAPNISPRKTVEGMAGGVIGSGVAIVLLSMAIGISANYYLFLFIMGLVMGTFSQLGDLCISSIKREAGVKDSSKRIIPGHGGLLDKFDGMLFVLPVCYFLIYFSMMIAGIPMS